jgi:hypothetical protein
MANAELVHVTATNVNIDIPSSVNFTGNLPPALSTRVTTVSAGTIMELTAAKADGQYINGPGTVNITQLHSTANAELVNVTATYVNVSFSGIGGSTVSFTGSLPPDLATRVTTVNSGTMELTALKANRRNINGQGTVNITELHSMANAELVNVTATFVNIVISSNVTFQGSLPPASATSLITVSATVGLVLTAAKADGQYITGAGTLNVTDLSTSQYDGANIYMTNAGNYRIMVSGEIHNDTNFTPNTGVSPILVPNSNVRMKATQISGLSLQAYDGNESMYHVMIKNLEDGASGDYSKIKATVCSYYVSNTINSLQAKLKNLSSSIYMTIDTNVTVNVNLNGGYIAEVLKFISDDVLSNKYVTIEGNGTINFILANGGITRAGSVYTVTDNNMVSVINSFTVYTNPEDPFELKTNGSPVVQTTSS